MKDPQARLESLLRTIVVALSRNGQNPQIHYDEQADALSVAVEYGEDKGRCIGRKGRIFWALATIVHETARRYGLRTRLEAMLEAKHPNQDKPPVPFKPSMNWDRKRLETFAIELLDTIFHSEPEWRLEDLGDGDVHVAIILSEKRDENLAEALGLIIRGVGSACGASVDVKVEWR